MYVSNFIYFRLCLYTAVVFRVSEFFVDKWIVLRITGKRDLISKTHLESSFATSIDL